MTQDELAVMRQAYTDPYCAVIADIAAQLLLQKQRATEVAGLEGDGATCPVDNINALSEWLLTIAKRHTERLNYARSVVSATDTDEAQRILEQVAKGAH